MASENLSYGFYLNTDSLVKDSTATENRGAGFHALSRVTIENSFATKNDTWGFYSEFPFFRVTESTALENEAGGIKALGEAPLVEGNSVTQRNPDEIGIYVGGARASVQRNTSSAAPVLRSKRSRNAPFRTITEGQPELTVSPGLAVRVVQPWPC